MIRNDENYKYAFKRVIKEEKQNKDKNKARVQSTLAAKSTSTTKKLLENDEYRHNKGNFFDTRLADLRFGSQIDDFHEFLVSTSKARLRFCYFCHRVSHQIQSNLNNTSLIIFFSVSWRGCIFQFHFFSLFFFKAPEIRFLRSSKSLLKFH